MGLIRHRPLHATNSACVVCCHYFPQLEGRLVDAVHAQLLPSVHAEVPGNLFLKHAVFSDVLEVFSTQITNMDEGLPLGPPSGEGSQQRASCLPQNFQKGSGMCSF